MELKRVQQINGKLKDVRIVDGNIVDDSGEIIDLLSILGKLYGDAKFSLSVTNKVEETLDIEEISEIDVDELAPDCE